MQRTPAAVDTYVGEEGFFIEEPPDSVGPGDNVIADFQRANLLLRDERGARDWNDEFQTLSVAHPTGSVDAEMLRVAKLRKLCIDFAEEAQRVARIIIKEQFMAAERRTIPPRTSTFGGVAGGEKYVHNSIFYKLAVDRLGIYGGDENAKKAAGHELKGLMAYIDCRVKGLHTPLMAVIHHHGYAVIAESILPINPTTLQYGSSDGGIIVVSKSRDLNAKMELAGKLLNLKGHTVYNRTKTERVFLYGPADLEGHLGTDNRFYVLDTARCFPPVAFDETSGNATTFLYRLFRPEFVRLNPSPLCSDTFSKFASGEDAVLHRHEVVQATQRLEGELLLSYAKELDTSGSSGWEGGSEGLQFIAELHLRGINARYILWLFSLVNHAAVKRVLATECLARAAKLHMNEVWRQLKSPNDDDYRTSLTDLLNTLLGGNSANFWRTRGRDCLQRVFVRPRGIAGELPDPVPLLDKPALLQRLREMLNFNVRTSLPEGADQPFQRGDISEVLPLVRHIHRVSFEEGTALVRLSATKRAGGEREYLLQSACRKFEDTLAIKPNDYRALYNYAVALQQLARITRVSSVSEAERLMQECGEKYQRALLLRPNDPKALFKWATAQLEYASSSSKLSAEEAIAILESAKAKLDQAVELRPRDFEALYNSGKAHIALAKALLKRTTSAAQSAAVAMLNIAITRFDVALSVKSTSVDAMQNLALCHAKKARLLPRAEDQEDCFKKALFAYEKALLVHPTNTDIMFNLGNCYFRHGKLKKESDPKGAVKLFFSAGEHYQKALHHCLTYSSSGHSAEKAPAPARDSSGGVSSNGLFLSGSSGGLTGSDSEQLTSFFHALTNLGLVLESLAAQKKLHKTQIDSFVSLSQTYCTGMENHLNGSVESLPLRPLMSLAEQTTVPLVRQNAQRILDKYDITPSPPVAMLDRSRTGSNVGSTSARGESPRGSPLLRPLRFFSSKKKNVALAPAAASSSSPNVNHKELPGRTRGRSASDPLLDEADQMALAMAHSTRASSGTAASLVTNAPQARIYLLEEVAPMRSPVLYVQKPENAINERDFQVLTNLTYRVIHTPNLGASASAFRVRHKGKTYIWESIKKESFTFADPFLRLTVANSPFVAQIVYIYQTDLTVNFVTRDIAGAFFSAADRHHPAVKLHEEHVRFYAAETAIAIETYHHYNAVYHNFNSRYVLLNEDGHVCLAPFQHKMFARSFNILQYYRDHPQDLAFVAPELVQSMNMSPTAELWNSATQRANWFAFGVFLHERLTGKVPWVNDSFEGLLREISECRPAIAKELLSKEAASLIEQLMQKDPSARPSIAGVKAHPFFASTQWALVADRRVDPPFKPEVFVAFRDGSAFGRATTDAPADTLLAPDVPNRLEGFTFAERVPTLGGTAAMSIKREDASMAKPSSNISASMSTTSLSKTKSKTESRK